MRRPLKALNTQYSTVHARRVQCSIKIMPHVILDSDIMNEKSSEIFSKQESDAVQYSEKILEKSTNFD